MNGLFKQRLFYVIAAMVLVTPWYAFSQSRVADSDREQERFQLFQRTLRVTPGEEEAKLKIERLLAWLTAQEKAGTIPSDRVIELKEGLLDRWSENAVKFAVQGALKTDREALWAELSELPLAVRSGLNMVTSNSMPNLQLVKM